MVLFNLSTLRNILKFCNDISTPEVWMAVAALNEKKKADALLFLNNNIEEPAIPPSGLGSLAFE